jgi:hypothetical protein
MFSLKLFNFPAEELNERYDLLETENPLGLIEIKTNSKLETILKYRDSSVFVLQGNDLYIEIVKAPITPKIPKHMQIEKCIAYLIRFKCIRRVQPKFSCMLVPKTDILKTDLESGERLISHSFDCKDRRLTIGTEDEESLQDRAKNRAGMPERFFSDNLISYENIEPIEAGLQVHLPLFLEGEEGQIQFVISWAQLKNNDPLSTWFAVDVTAEEILTQI